MIAAEFKTSTATIRIHDEYIEAAADGCIRRLSRIVSESYRRRQMQNHAVAALNAVEGERGTHGAIC